MFDGFRNNWILFYAAPEGGRLRVAHKPVGSGSWSTEVDAQDQYVEAGLMNFRYLGEGAVNPSTGQGAFFAAMMDPVWSADNAGKIVMMPLTFSGGRYRLSLGDYAGGYASDFETSRPFGVAYDPGTNAVAMFWQSRDNPTQLCGSSKTGLATTPYFPASVCVSRNPTSITAARISGKWAVGYSN